MVRLLFWIALIAAAVWFWRKFKSPAAAPRSPNEPTTTPMVRCAHCGVHLPQDRALSQSQQWYCSQAHLQQGPGNQDR
ncbi:PP0621 family protein [Pseudomonas sp. Au-Pse12]|uniref:PP0621 family protein n=1 Tax=Pseudomonas sp. Au-Pse12 TaxID=2906459 RepID=UPI001E5C49BA|nr:PP0621 family protein [Pseudomonas sp. Au-Pse12]MCE4056738.1 envelope stress response protein PspG [Pseudomonas sp. Au-Pse12]